MLASSCERIYSVQILHCGGVHSLSVRGAAIWQHIDKHKAPVSPCGHIRHCQSAGCSRKKYAHISLITQQHLITPKVCLHHSYLVLRGLCVVGVHILRGTDLEIMSGLLMAY